MKRSNTIMLAAALAAFGLSARAQTPAEKHEHHHEAMQGPAKARHEAMEHANDAMKALAAMAKRQHPFDPAVVQARATSVLERLQEASKLFPPGSDTGETHAKPEIWSDRPGFDKAMQDAQGAARALQSVEDEASFRPALGRLGQSCKACHDKYRMPVD